MERVKLLRQVAADLDADKAPGAVQDGARTLLRHYLEKANRIEAMGGPGLELRERGKPKRRGRRRKLADKQARSRKALLRVIRKSDQPLTGTEIRRRLAQGGRRLSRQAVGYHLHRLKRLGEVEKVAAGRPRWQSAQSR